MGDLFFCHVRDLCANLHAKKQPYGKGDVDKEGAMDKLWQAWGGGVALPVETSPGTPPGYARYSVANLWSQHPPRVEAGNDLLRKKRS